MLTFPKKFTLPDLVRESNKIEGIFRDPTEAELNEASRFLSLSEVDIGDLRHFVEVFQPGAVLREKVGLNVRVGRHLPPAGAPKIKRMVQELLVQINKRELSPWKAHCLYEDLHPFTDGNGRSGRMLWLWMMQDAPLGFMHTFYYQTLEEARRS